MSKLDKEGRFYETKLQAMKTVRLQQLEATEKFEQQKKKKRAKLVDFVDRKSEAFTNQKFKHLINFDKSILVALDRWPPKKVLKSIQPLDF